MGILQQLWLSQVGPTGATACRRLLTYARRRTIVLSLAPLLAAVFAFPQTDIASIDHASQLGEETMLLICKKQISAGPAFPIFEYFAALAASAGQEARKRPLLDLPAQGFRADEDAKIQPSVERLGISRPGDFNQEIFYRNKLEFSLDGGWLPINIPFPLDVFVGDAYNTYPLKYTLVPFLASLRWHIDGVRGPSILRGNFDLTFSGSVTAIPRGPESRYFSYSMGIRRNFVPRNRRTVPYFDIRLGVGNIDAKGPTGVKYAQGQDLTFTVNMGSGMRYDFNSRYAISAGLNFMHISNLDLSQSNGKPNWGVRNYGINVYGPVVGIDIQLRRHRRQSKVVAR